MSSVYCMYPRRKDAAGYVLDDHIIDLGPYRPDEAPKTKYALAPKEVDLNCINAAPSSPPLEVRAASHHGYTLIHDPLPHSQISVKP